MNIHKNARLTPLRRGEMALAVLEGGLTKGDIIFDKPRLQPHDMT